MTLLVVGTGLIGTSIGLALRGADVLLTDADDERLATAVARGAGLRWDGRTQPRHVVVAIPPHQVAGELSRLQALLPGSTFSHVASSQTAVQRELEALPGDPGAVCGTHPMAGRELSGPAAATADLFVGRPWALCPGPLTTPAALDAARALARRCGAETLVVPAHEHDSAVALVSHLPQVAASAVAAVLLAATATPSGLDPVRLAGPGLQDTTRVAASDPDLWLDVLTLNAAAVAPLVHALAGTLLVAADALTALAAGGTDPEPAERLLALLRDGNAGRARVPVKDGGLDRDFASVAVAVPDRPGRLAAVLASAAEAGINVEDVRVDHLDGRRRGIIELLVAVSVRDSAAAALTAAGWDVLA